MPEEGWCIQDGRETVADCHAGRPLVGLAALAGHRAGPASATLDTTTVTNCDTGAASKGAAEWDESASATDAVPTTCACYRWKGERAGQRKCPE